MLPGPPARRITAPNGVMMRAGKTQIGLTQDDWKKGRDRKRRT